MGFAYYTKLEGLTEQGWEVVDISLGYESKGGVGPWLHEGGLFPFESSSEPYTWHASVAALEIGAWESFELYAHVEVSERDLTLFERGDQAFPDAFGNGLCRFKTVGEPIDWRHGRQRDLRNHLRDGQSIVVSYKTTLASVVSPLLPLRKLQAWADSETHRVVLWCG